MNDDPDESTLYQIIEEVFKNGSSNPDYQKILNSFSSNSSNLTKCKEMIENTNNTIYVQDFASKALLKLSEENISNWEVGFSIELCEWSIMFMIKNSLALEKVIFFNLSDLVAHILEYYWNLGEENHQACMNEWDEIARIFDRNPNEWVTALSLINSIHDNLIQSKDNKIVQSFSEDCLSRAFSLAFGAAKRITNSSVSNFEIILEYSLDIIEKCISDYKEKYSIDGLDFQEQVNFYFDVYNNFQIFKSLNCLYAISNLISMFNFPNKPSIVELLCNGFHSILVEKINTINEDHLRYIFSILSNIATHLRISMIQQMKIDKNLEKFFTLMFELTNSIIQPSSNHELSTIKSLILFWKNISASIRNDGNCEPKMMISEFAPQLCLNYIKYLLDEQYTYIKNQIDGQTLKSQISSSEEIVEDENIDNNYIDLMERKISSFIFPVQSFVILNHDKICPDLLLGLKEKQEELISSLESTEEDIMIKENQLALFVEVATVVLLIKKSGSKIDPKIKYHPDFFAFLINLFHLSEEWASKGIILPRLEMSIILFITNFKSTLFGCNEESLYRQLRKKRVFSSFEDCQYYLFHRAIATLRLHKERCLLSQALSIIYNSYNKIVPSMTTLEKIFEEPFEKTFPFINEFENVSLRSRFYSAMFSIIKKLDYTDFPKFSEMMFGMLESRIGEIDIESAIENEETKKQICLLSIDLCGIFKEAKENEIFIQVFEWFISDDKSKLFEDTASFLFNQTGEVSENDDIVINSILEMWKSISLCTPRTRIVFDSSSSNGITIFKKAAKILTQFYDNIEKFESKNDLTEEKINGIEYSFIIFQNLIGGKYVPFGAFKVYNDTIFIDLLNMMMKMMTESFISTIEQYPSTFFSMYGLFKELMVNQTEILFDSFNPLVILTLNITIDMLNNQKEVQQNTLDTILSFLQYLFDAGIDCKQFEQQIININSALWNKILNENADVNETVINNLKMLYLLNPWLLTSIKNKIKQNLSNRKKPILEEFFQNLDHFLSDDNSQSDIISCIKDIIEVMYQCTPVLFVEKIEK